VDGVDNCIWLIALTTRGAAPLIYCCQWVEQDCVAGSLSGALGMTMACAANEVARLADCVGG
jgi:hypothetical protein